VAAGRGVDPAGWQTKFGELMARVAGRFVRVETRARARAFVSGLLAPIDWKNAWWLAEHAGEASPYAMQRLLCSAVWDADALCGDVRDFVVAHLGHRKGVLICDETGFVKKGKASAGVQRQYTGTAGRIENSQVGVFLTYASPRGRALIDRRLYLPQHTWCADPARRAGAGVPAQVRFATKPELAAQMTVAALDAGVPAAWVTAEEVYGGNSGFRAALEDRRVGSVLAVACDEHVDTRAGRFRVDALTGRLPKRAWQRVSAGAGAKGPRY
jgi:SRSO17 transposase